MVRPSVVLLDSPSVVLLGSAATNWPRPGCGCRTCLRSGEPGLPATLRVGELTVIGSSVRTAAGDPVDVLAGEAAELAGVRVLGLPTTAGEVALVLAGRSTGTVLWSPGEAPPHPSALEALRDAALDVAVLGAGPDGRALAATLAQLRRVSALAAGCDVVAAGLDHHTPPERLAGWLPRWGARLAPNGASLGAAHAPPPRTPPRRTLVLGPASSGKSAFAEALLAGEPEVDYLPTGPAPTPDDADWAGRVATHRGRRPSWWRTLEGTSPVTALTDGGPPLLLDSLGTWVSGVLDRCGAWDDAGGWQQAFDAEVDAAVGAWRRTGRQVVAVGEETGWGVVPATPAGRRFRDALGQVTRRLADESEQVLLVVAGRATDLAEGVPGV